MLRRGLRWIAVSLLIVVVVVAAFGAYLYATPLPLHEFDSAWYHTRRGVTEVFGRSFHSQHRWAMLHAQADHFAHPIGPGRIVVLLGASPPDDSGDVFLYFGSAFVSSSAA